MALNVLPAYLPIWLGNTGPWPWYVKLTADHLCGDAVAGGRAGGYVGSSATGWSSGWALPASSKA
jgi:hypothetical protein